MSDDLPDSAKRYVLMGLKNLVRDGMRRNLTRDEILKSLHERGLKRETAEAFLKKMESPYSHLINAHHQSEMDAMRNLLASIGRPGKRVQ
jgi:hypothetical protein